MQKILEQSSYIYIYIYIKLCTTVGLK